MAALTPVEFPLANIARVEITTEEDTPVIYRLTNVATDADIVAYVNAGAQTVLRVKNVIKAQNNFEDLILGYDVKLSQATFIPEILELVDGGVWTVADKKYAAPVTGAPVERTLFTLDIYTEEKDGDGSTLNIVKFSYKNCKGTPVNYKATDGAFYSPELNIKSRSKLGESPAEVTILTELPA